MEGTDVETETSGLVHTKLRPPVRSDGVVQRPRLLRKLGGELGGKITLISAPAGFGKTTLVCDWLTSRGLPLAWLSLDATDSDPVTFLRYLVASVRIPFPRACSGTLALTRAPQLPPVPVLATALINDLDALPDDFVLVLDDYHVIQDETVHQLVGRLAQYSPPHLNLILLCRQDPPLPLARLRAGRRLTELRAADLRFTLAEARDFFKRAVQLDLPSDTLTALHQRTEGWIAGLQLAAISLHDAADPTTFVAGFRGSSRNVMEYLVDEVLSYQARGTRSFLLRTSILERFCAPLCQAVLAEEKPVSYYAETLAKLARQNLLLRSLDQEGTWYRYDHLFRELLQHLLVTKWGAAQIAAMHARASEWFARQGLTEEALHQALAGGDVPCAAGLIAANRHAMLNREEWHTLDRWLRLLPTEAVQGRLDLSLARAWVLYFQLQPAVWSRLLPAAQQLLGAQETTPSAADGRAMAAELALLRAMEFSDVNRFEEALPLLDQALADLPASCLFARGTAVGYLALHRHSVGQHGMAESLLRQALDAQDQTSVVTARLLTFLCEVYHLAGRLEDLVAAAHRLRVLGEEHGLLTGTAWAHYCLGSVHYERNELPAATRHYSQVMDLRYAAYLEAFIGSSAGLSLAEHAQSRPGTADAMARDLCEGGDAGGLLLARCHQARLAVMNGDLEAALRLAPSPGEEPQITTLAECQDPRIVRALALLGLRTPGSMTEAARLAQDARRAAESVHYLKGTLESMAVTALVLQARGRLTEALVALGEAVTLGQAGGFIRTFLDLGPTLIPLMLQLPAPLRESAYVRALQASVAEPCAAGPERPVPRGTSAMLTVDPLTNREMDILRLMAQRLSDKEIAQALVISRLTVSTHATNLYHKLGVSGRRLAVARGLELGLLPVPPVPPVR